MVKTNDFLSKLYIAASDEEMPFGDGLNLGELYERLDEVQEKEKKFGEELEKLGLSPQLQDEIGSLHWAVYTAFEKQGFINGFKMGMMAAQETGMWPVAE